MSPNKKKSLRCFWSSNSPWATSGYSQQMADLLPLFVKEGYPTAISCFYGLEGGNIDWKGVTCYPKISDQWGADAMANHSATFKADVVFTLQDLWVVDPGALKTLKRWIPVVPVDHEPIPKPIFDRLKLADRIIAYAPFGQRELASKGLNSIYIPHTVDTNVYKPVNNKMEVRKKIGIKEDTFLFGMVAANKDNPPRKSFQEAMDAFYKFQKVHENSALYIHTLTKQQGGFNIDEYAAYLGISNKIYNIQPYELMFLVDKEGMAKIYNAMDCLLAPSQNEGFGVPIVEAQACGVPVITTDFTAMRDLVIEGETGYKVKVLHKRFTALGAYVAYPDTESIYESMEKVFSADRPKMAIACRKFIMENFDLKLVWDTKWKPLLSTLEKEIYPD
jgi:glycosyltransferase involved in cell wall biosynthesis